MPSAIPMSVHEQRLRVRLLLDDSSPADAPTAYYALFSNPSRAALYTRVDVAGRMVGFAGCFHTGIDLFRPLVTLRCWDSDVAADLLAEALTAGRPYILFAGVNQLPLLSGRVQIVNERILRIYHLDPARFQPELNVLVRHETAGDGSPRCVIDSNGVRAVAGVNWRSPAFAEVYVHTDEAARGRGWGTSVASGVTQAILEDGRIPIYLVEQHNEASERLAESLGYIDTGARQVYADMVYEG